MLRVSHLWPFGTLSVGSYVLLIKTIENTNHKGNTNHNQLIPILSKPKTKKKIASIGKDVEKLEWNACALLVVQ